MPAYPEFAWFEGLVNAVTHRDYSFRGDYIRVSMFDDRLEIVSPGSLPNIVTLDNMRTTRYSRNPRIARTLVEFGWVRELNEGVKRIYTEMQDSLLNDPVYTEPGRAKVQLTLENNIVARTVRRSEALEDKLSAEELASLDQYELAAICLAFTNGKVTARELADHIGRTRRTAGSVLRDFRSFRSAWWLSRQRSRAILLFTIRFAPISHLYHDGIGDKSFARKELSGIRSNAPAETEGCESVADD